MDITKQTGPGSIGIITALAASGEVSMHVISVDHVRVLTSCVIAICFADQQGEITHMGQRRARQTRARSDRRPKSRTAPCYLPIPLL